MKRISLAMIVLLLASGCTLFSGLSSDDSKDEIVEQPERKDECEGPNCSDTIDDPRPEQRSSWTFYEEPVPIEEREITFESKGAELKGTVILPQSTEKDVPGFVIVHDLGPHGRDGVAKESFGLELPVEIPMYRSLAEQLASRGFAVLIYDKRSCVKGGPPWCEYPRNYVEAEPDRLVEFLIDDARSAARALGQVEGVSEKHLGLIGHGQGAEIALDITESNPEMFWSLVLVNPSAYPIDDLVMHQTERSIEAIEKKYNETKPSAARDEMKAQLESLREKRDTFRKALSDLRKTKESATDILDLPANVWLASFALHVRASQALRSLETPSLALLGEADFDTPEDNTAVYDGLIAENESIRVVAVEGLTHLMVDLDEDPTGVSEQMMVEISEFLRSLGDESPSAQSVSRDTPSEAR